MSGIKMKKIKKLHLEIIAAFLIILSLGSPGLATTADAMTNLMGTNFSNNFGLIVDFNYGDPANPPSSLSSNFQVLQDLGNPNNPKVNPVDKNPWYDQQYFFSNFNVSGVNNIYLALNKVEFNLTIPIPLSTKTVNLGHINASAPFQTLLQYYKYQGQDVLVANTFRGLIAYSTTANDGKINSTDQSYFGYSFVESHLLGILNTALTNHGFSAIPAYGYKPIYDPTTHTFGMNYTNYFVVWQDTKPSGYGGNFPTSSSFNGVAVGNHIVAASLFKYLSFTYHVETVSQNATSTIVQVTTKYSLGPMQWLITTDNSSAYSAIQAADPNINSSNSFQNSATGYSIVIDVGSNSAYQANINIPTLTFYTNDAVPQRINAQAMASAQATGFGIAIASSTNAYVQGSSTIDNGGAQTNAQNINIPLSFGNDNFFQTNYAGKSTYTRTFTNGTTETDPVYISLRSLANMNQLIDTSSLINGYFDLQSLQTYGLSIFSASQLDPHHFTNSWSISQMKMDTASTNYVTLVQMPYWSGLQVVQDPTFSAVAAVASNGSSGNTSSISSTPGFEMVAILAVIPLVYLKKKHNK